MTDIHAQHTGLPRYSYTIHDARVSDDGTGLYGAYRQNTDGHERDALVFKFTDYDFSPARGEAHRNLKVEDKAGIAALLEASRTGSVPVVIEYVDRNGRYSTREATVSHGGDSTHVAVQTDDGPRSLVRTRIQAVSI